MNKPKLSYPCIPQFANLVELKDYRPTTKKEYVRYLVKLAEHFQCDPSTLGEDQLREYFLFLRQHKNYGGSAMSLARSSLRCFFRDCLKRTAWTIFEELAIRRVEPLPVVLTREQVARVLGVIREPRFRTALRLIYHCGLRVSEAVRLEVGHIEGAALRLHVRCGKGGKDRYVPLATGMLGELRQWWTRHRHPRLLFPSPGRAWKDRSCTLSESMHRATVPMSVSSVQMAFRLAREAAGLNPTATVHTLRHSYATHLLEEGVSVRLISQYLGHESLETTVIYTHLTAVSEAQTRVALATLHRALGA
jgi:site-specific recombinase XerD